MGRLGFYIKLIALFWAMTAGGITLSAGELDSLWRAGNDAYAMGDYRQAADIYGEIESKGFASAPLYYNLANAYYKQREAGKAILYYERALKLDPSDPDARNNLEIARQFTLDKIEAVPDFILSTWTGNVMNSFSSDRWAVSGIVSLAVAAFLLLGFRFAPGTGLRKVSFVLACAATAAALVFFIFAFTLKSRTAARNAAIVTVPVSNVKSAPNTTGSNLFILHEGTRVELLEEVGPWYRVELSDGRQGWMPASDTEII